ncbi:MarR family winged helix-turn-helix transcriptional regulator [Zhongshania arctica]|uniref:MarR family winged helix-turn-helix transcriptional regulator n=1 Tax=Zhongshania arctica TaxID=3238302 RepID=A0ABV3U0B1_9GAMM
MKSTRHLQIAASTLTETSRLVREDFRRRAQHLNLTQPQWLTLLKLSREPGINQACLAEHFDVNPVTVAQSVDRLVKAGLVLRERQEQDRRAVSLYLTDKAEPLLEELNGIAEQTRAIAFAGISAAEAKVLEELLLRVKNNFCDSSDIAVKPGMSKLKSVRSSKEGV